MLEAYESIYGMKIPIFREDIPTDSNNKTIMGLAGKLAEIERERNPAVNFKRDETGRIVEATIVTKDGIVQSTITYSPPGEGAWHSIIGAKGTIEVHVNFRSQDPVHEAEYRALKTAVDKYVGLTTVQGFF